jgi:WD40 repeat protein
MSEQHDPFSPQHVDESVEQLSAAGQFDPRRQAEPNARLVRDMQRLYGLERKQYLRALQRVQDRLVAQRISTDEQPTAPLELGQLWTAQHMRAPADWQVNRNMHVSASLPGGQARAYPETGPLAHTSPGAQRPPFHTRTARVGRRANLLVALLVVIVLVGSLVFVLHEIRPNILVGTNNVSTATPSSSPAHYTPGQVLYTRSNSSSVMQVAWSPDSQRIATSYSGVQIWDATTGGHVVNVQLPPDLVIRAMAWSPDGKWIAIGIDTAIVIADTHTGKLVHQFPLSALVEREPATNSPYLVTMLPTNGGQGVSPVNALAWSPDGRLLAVNIDEKTISTSKGFSLLNAQTGTLVHRFSAADSYDLGPASWSADGKYLAAIGASLSDAVLKQVLVWNASTYQIVLKRNVDEEVDMYDVPAWQPGSDNLAFIDYQKAGTRITLWDVAANTLVKRYTTLSDRLSWSSDGKYLAVRAFANHIPSQVVVLDARSGRQVYIFHTKHLSQIAVIAWSPNGKYILSGEDTGAGGATIMEVWAAP